MIKHREGENHVYLTRHVYLIKTRDVTISDSKSKI